MFFLIIDDRSVLSKSYFIEEKTGCYEVNKKKLHRSICEM